MCVKPISFTYGTSSLGQLAVAEKARLPVLPHLAPPRPEVHLVDGHRPVEPRVRRAPFARSSRRPATRSLTCRARPTRCAAAARCRRRTDRTFSSSVPGARADLELVSLARLEIGQEDLPHAARHEVPHHVHAAVPPVEVAHDADALRRGRPHREMHAARVPQRDHVRAELLVRPQVPALAEQVHVEVGQHAAEVVGIAALHGDAAREVRRRRGNPPPRATWRRRTTASNRPPACVRSMAMSSADGMQHAQHHLARGRLEHADDRARPARHPDAVRAR